MPMNKLIQPGWLLDSSVVALHGLVAPSGRAPTARLTRVRSTLTHKVMVVVGQIASIHQGLLAEESDQLPFLGLMQS